MRILLRALALLLLAFAPFTALAAEFTPAQRAEIVEILREALRKDPSILREAVAAIQADEARGQDEAARAALVAERSRLVDPNDPVGGNPKGDVTIVEYFDVRCGYCRKLEPAMAELLRQDRNVRLVYKDLPILGPGSTLGAKALLAAQVQGGYEKLRAVLMTSAPEPTRDNIRAEAVKLGLDADKLLRDMDSPSVAARIAANLAQSNRLGIRGTPAMVIGDVMIPGAIDIAELREAVAAARKSAK
jgi:protein-disulfide isomerase